MSELRLMQAMAGAAHGGAERHFVRLVLALHRAGVTQSVVMRPDAAREAALAEAGIEPVPAPFGRILDLWTRARWRQAIRAFAPDVVLSHMSRAAAACPGGDFVHVGRLGGYYPLRHYRSCDHLVGDMPDIVDHIVAVGWPRERAHYLPNLVGDRADAAPADRAALDTPGEAPLIVALGRLHPSKAFDVLLDAMAKLPEAYLWLGGDGPEADALRDQAARLGLGGRVRFLGWIADPAPYLRAADAVAVPSRHEPLGSVVIEAWMARAPVVAAASQGALFLIEDGRTGLLVPVDDAAALAEALGHVLGDKVLAEGLVAHGRAAYEASHTEAAAVDAYFGFFERVRTQRRAAA